MDRDILEALHRADAAGGKDLADTRITTLKGEAKKTLFKRLLDANYLAKAGKKFDMTDAGRAAYQAAPADMLDDLRSAPLLAVLALIQAKKGKLSAGDLKKVNEADLAEARTRGYLGDGDKPGLFKLLPAGELRLLAQADLGTQVEQLRPLLNQTEARIKALLQRLGKELPAAPTEGEGLAARLDREAGEALAALARAVTTAAAIPEVADLGRQAAAKSEATLEQARAEVRKAHELAEQMTTERAALTTLETALRNHLERLDTLAARQPAPAPAPTPTPAQAPQPTPPPTLAPTGPTEEQLWQATVTAHAELRKRGTVKIPELADAILAVFPALTRAGYSRQLQTWHDADRLNLEAANSANAELRSSEGIPSTRGLLFYVHLNG